MFYHDYLKIARFGLSFQYMVIKWDAWNTVLQVYLKSNQNIFKALNNAYFGLSNKNIKGIIQCREP